MAINWQKNAEIGVVGAIAVGLGMKYLSMVATMPVLKEEFAGIKIAHVAFIFAGLVAYNYARDRFV